MRHLATTRSLELALAIVIGLGTGCGGGNLGGCGALAALPKAPGPTGFPFDQEIEGGMQVRITKPGFDKLSSVIPPLIQKGIPSGICAIGEQNVKLGPFSIVKLCNNNACPNGATGCPAHIILDSPDKKDGILLSMADGQNPVLVANVGVDIDVPVHVSPLIGGSCDLEFYTQHYKDGNASPLHVIADIQMGIDKPTGELTLGPVKLHIDKLSFAASGSGGLCGIGGDIFNFVFKILDTQIGNLLTNLLLNALQGPLTNLVQGFLPKPPGLAGVLNTGASLASFDAPKSAALELFLVAGGYVSALGGGLNLGILSGINSDRDPSTRDPGLTSEPALCVPMRPAPDLGGAPWNLPATPDRPDHMLAPANEFSGKPDPMNGQGMTQDLAIGVSRTFLDLAGFHIYNSGTMCLAVGGGALSALNAGALTVLVPSLGNILENRKSPLSLVLRPQVPLHFTIGAGTVDDPLLHIHVEDLRIDFYAFIEERYVRIFTLGVDMDVQMNLTLSTDGMGNPTIQPMITGIDKKSIQMRVINTDLLQEDPVKLAKTLTGLVDIAVGQLMGGIKPFPLPALMGFSLDGLSITRVQTTQDDFLAIFGSLVSRSGATDYPPESWVPEARAPHPVTTTAQAVDVSVPPSDVIREAVLNGDLVAGSVPSVTLKLGGTGGEHLEWSYRVDQGGWHAWSSDPKPTLADPAFQLQGKHVVEVRARERGDWLSEDQAPAVVDVLIDSVAPSVKPAVESGRVLFHGSDNVSDDGALRYAWKTPAGWTAFSGRDGISVDEAVQAAGGAGQPLHVAALDEAGNRGEGTLDLGGYNAFHGRTTTPAAPGGCGCVIGGASSSGGGATGRPLLSIVSSLSLLGLLLRRRVRARWSRATGRRAVAAVMVLGAGVAFQAGCSCNGQVAASRCFVDDDCRTKTCPAGQIPQCMPDGTCACTPDTPIGDVGRYASMAMRGGTAYLAAYNNTYGDLMIGHIQPPGVVTNWEFVDGVPEGSPSDNPLSQVRGGISDKGDDVGKYASIAVTPAGDPVVAYYDLTHASLKFASFGAVRWHAMTVDKASGNPAAGGDDFGRFASLTLDKDGRPGIAYYAEVAHGMSGGRESQLRFAQATTVDPQGPQDFQVTVVESRPIAGADGGGPDGGAPPPKDVLPGGIALFVSSARRPDGAPVVAYYDRERGNLRYVEYDAGAKAWGTPVILDGEDPTGKDTADVGQYPSVVYADNAAHITYVDATHDNLLYVETQNRMPEVVDDGYRPKDEMTMDGIPSPVYHLVGDSSSIQVSSGQVLVAYQDSTVEQLRFAARDPVTKKWVQVTVAGHGSPFKGSYGFYAQNRVIGGIAVLSTYAVNQHADIPSYYVETFSLNLGTIM